MDYTVNQHQRVNLDAHQNADGNSVIGGAIHQLTHNILNKAKRNAINAQSQIDLAKELDILFSQIAADLENLLNGLFMMPPILNVNAAKNLGRDIGKLVGLKHDDLGAGLSAGAKKALYAEADGAIKNFTKQILAILPDSLTVPSVPSIHLKGGKEPDPFKAFIKALLDGKGNYSDAQITKLIDKSGLGKMATLFKEFAHFYNQLSPGEKAKYAALMNKFLGPLTFALEGGAEAANSAAGQAIAMSEIMTAKLNWAVNIMQEIMSTASKFADKAFKVELQMQGRIRAN